MVAPPGVPADRVKILRDAYAKALKDPDLLAEVNKSRLDMEPSTGEEIQNLYKELMSQPREVIELVKETRAELTLRSRVLASSYRHTGPSGKLQAVLCLKLTPL